MNKNDILKLYEKSNEHLIDITNCGNYVCVKLLKDGIKTSIPCSQKQIKEFNYCPFCGEKIKGE